MGERPRNKLLLEPAKSKSSMKTYLYYFIIALLSVRLEAAAFGQINKRDEITNHIEMSISLSNRGTNVSVNQPLALRIVFKNISTNRTFSICNSVREGDEEGYSFVVTTPSGTNKTILTGSSHGSAAIIPIPPGETRESRFNLSRLYDFHEIGIYKVVAKYRNLWASPYFEAVSNPLEINVVKGPEKSEAPQTNNPLSRWSQ